MTSDKWVDVVTGAGQGIGRAVAERLACDGEIVITADLDEQAAQDAAETITAAGYQAVPCTVDVADEQDVERLAAVAATHGSIRVWVNNAGISRPAMLHKMTADDFDAVLRTHTRGTFLGIRAAARHMIERSTTGSIINVTSSAGLLGTIGQINYSAAKGAVTAMTKSAARELARYGIRVNAVSPMAATRMTEKIRTDPRLAERYLEQIPLGRFAEPIEIAHAFAFLASEGSGYVTGQVICVDGGTAMPA